MSTRSLTFLYGDENKESLSLVIYRHMDGYLSGHGKDIAEFMKTLSILDEGLTDDSNTCNGMEEWIAHFICHFKNANPNGNIYVYPFCVKDAGQEYEYHIYPEEIVVKKPRKRKPLFKGTWQQYVNSPNLFLD